MPVDPPEEFCMSQVRAVAAAHIHAPAEKVSAALADYTNVRPQILPPHYSDYQVLSGGVGAGTVVHWKFAPTEKRVRDCKITVTTPEEGVLVETDANSSMVTTYTVVASDDGHASVVIETVWNGAGGIGGFFERTFAPRGLLRIYEDLLERLTVYIQADK
jgi:Polyketide cyclase / dehydrase and lipid transport